MKKKKETKEVVQVSQADTVTINKLKTEKKPFEVYEKEMKETQDDDVLDPYSSGETTQQPHQVGPDTNDGFGVDPGKTPGMYQDGMDEADNIEEKKSKKDQNPYAVCTSSIGLEGRQRDSYTKAEKAKFERCVTDVKKTMKEGKNHLQPIIESVLRKLVEKHINPRMTKSDLLNTLSEQGIIKRNIDTRSGSKSVGELKNNKPIGKYYSMTKKEAMEQSPTTSPPKVRPGTTERPDKMDPFKNPKHQPKPKAGKNMVDDNPKSSVTKIPDYVTFDQLGITFKK